MITTRFAPSPSGKLHLGHAYSALRAWNFAQEHGGRFLLRIEDIDFQRCAVEFEDLLKRDLEWLGLRWEEPVRRQSDHLEEYREAAERLREMGLLYPCFCTRKEIRAEIERAGAAPHGNEGPVYPGICRELSKKEKEEKIAAGRDFAWRLDLAAALETAGQSLSWMDLEHGEVSVAEKDWAALGDVVLVRKDIQTSYHLAVVIDDAFQGVSHVVRGRDLFESTHVHVLLQHLMGLPQPVYLHHQLIAGEDGRRLAKRDESETLSSLRESGASAREIRDRLFPAAQPSS